MPYTALAILIAAFIISFTLARGFRHMAKTVTDAAADITAAVSAIAADIASALSAIAESISEHVANGTAVDAIEGQAQRLRDLDTQLQNAETPVAPVSTVTGGQGDDTVAGPAGDDTVSAPAGDDTISA